MDAIKATRLTIKYTLWTIRAWCMYMVDHKHERRTVPRPWEEAAVDSPRTMGSFCLSTSSSCCATMAPIMPVIITVVAVMGAAAPAPSA
eukprot:1712763-Pyramimonas_sp.AAC.1